MRRGEFKEILIGARAVQGVGGAVVSAVALTLMMTLFTDREPAPCNPFAVAHRASEELA